MFWIDNQGLVIRLRLAPNPTELGRTEWIAIHAGRNQPLPLRVSIHLTHDRVDFVDRGPLERFRPNCGVLDRPFLGGPHDAYFEVVGVVRDYKTRGDNSRQDLPEVFILCSVQAWRAVVI